MKLSHKPRFLIARLSAIGDCIHTLPLANALRKHFPRCHITWLVQQGPAAPLLSAQKSIDHLWLLPKNWLRRPREAWHLRKQFRQYHFDVAFDAQSLTKSSAALWLSGCPNRIGFAKGQGREIAPWLNNHLVKPKQEHVVEKYLELLAPLNLKETTTVDFDIHIPLSAHQKMESYLANNFPAGHFALVNVGAGWESKLWPYNRYAQVAQNLWDKHQLPSLIVWAGKKEFDLAQTIQKEAPPAVTLAPKTDLLELGALARRATFFLGSDTGPLHLAAAVGARCVGLYGPTLPTICGPYGQQNISLQVFYQYGNRKQRKGRDNRAMQAITTEMVLGACYKIIGEPPQKHGSSDESSNAA
ncbi:MAG: glycosyltransferase family 9 protein [Pirellulaceae bacterium]|nr:glycosyltransferase family 9 protein [Pirellulaceae bacterium]